MNIQHTDDSKQGLFYIQQDGSHVAEMKYYWQDRHSIVINHTEVAKSLEGKGIGKQLVEQAVRFARERRLTVIPQCPFARKVITATPEWQDVLKTH